MTGTARAAAVAGSFEITSACPSCGAAAMRGFYRQAGVPSHSCLLMDDVESARTFPRGDIELGACERCGFVANVAVDTSLQAYSESYEETQGFSPRFQEFAHGLAVDLVAKHDLHGKDILEIGCGKAEFLVDLCEIGDNRGVGIDPSVIPDRIDSPAAERIELIADYYGERYAHLTGDFVVCRHTLEHIAPVGEFMRLLRRTLEGRPEAVVFFELPEVVRELREVAFWDIYYEHCSYFSPGSLARLFRDTGFEVTDLALAYDDQYILIEARAADPAGTPPLELEETPEELLADVAAFEANAESVFSHWASELERMSADGGRVVVWGSGSKGVAFLNAIAGAERVEYVVDINPFKHGKFMAGTGQEIIAPERLRDYRPDHVIAMNPIYLEEIQRSLDELGVQAELTAV
ncbi:MAG TPA: class I SAM-dependent methyltransferase [Solirubrobacterales bacterium]|nr:class I SAM-dependent methyltransferase [Solirubrobacterales bacterium]